MKQTVITALAPAASLRMRGQGHTEDICRTPCHRTTARGLAVLNSPTLNKGTAFEAEERKSLGLTGLLPPEISTIETQVRRAYIQYELLPDALSRNIFLTALHDRNEVLFFRL